MKTKVKFDDTGEIRDMEMPDPWPIRYTDPQPGDVVYDVIRTPESPDHMYVLRRKPGA